MKGQEEIHAKAAQDSAGTVFKCKVQNFWQKIKSILRSKKETKPLQIIMDTSDRPEKGILKKRSTKCILDQPVERKSVSFEEAPHKAFYWLGSSSDTIINEEDFLDLMTEEERDDYDWAKIFREEQDFPEKQEWLYQEVEDGDDWKQFKTPIF